MEKLSVVSPVGLPSVKPTAASGRLGSLEGKVIGEIWNGDFKGDVTFPIIRKLLQKRYPSLRIIPYTDFPHTHVSDDPAKQRERAAQFALLAREKGCDAIMSGNGA